MGKPTKVTDEVWDSQSLRLCEKQQEPSLTEKEAVEILKKVFSRDKVGFARVLRHSRAVQKTALRIARKNQKKGMKVDIPFVSTSSLLHDIGRARCPPRTKGSVRHGVIGARLLRSEHLLRYARVAERHIGAGLTPFEAKKLGLPPGNYIPRTIEEKIVAHADNLIEGDKETSFSHVYKRYEKELGKRIAEKLLRLKKQVDQ